MGGKEEAQLPTPTIYGWHVRSRKIEEGSTTDRLLRLLSFASERAIVKTNQPSTSIEERQVLLLSARHVL